MMARSTTKQRKKRSLPSSRWERHLSVYFPLSTHTHTFRARYDKSLPSTAQASHLLQVHKKNKLHLLQRRALQETLVNTHKPQARRFTFKVDKNTAHRKNKNKGRTDGRRRMPRAAPRNKNSTTGIIRSQRDKKNNNVLTATATKKGGLDERLRGPLGVK